MRFFLPFAAASLWIVAGAVPSGRAADDVEYDLVVRNGQIVDGTGNPWFAGDVAIQGGKIAAVGRVPAGKAKREIDARGLVVAPGFIDMHSHSDTVLLEDGLAQSKIRQGVTTDVLGEGSSAGPRVGKLSPQSMLVGGKPVEWKTLEGQELEDYRDLKAEMLNNCKIQPAILQVTVRRA